MDCVHRSMATRMACGPASSSRETGPAMTNWAASARNHRLPGADASKPRGQSWCRSHKTFGWSGEFGSHWLRRVPAFEPAAALCRESEPAGARHASAKFREARRSGSASCSRRTEPQNGLLALRKSRQQRSYCRNVEHLVEVGIKVSDGVDDRSVVFVANPARRV